MRLAELFYFKQALKRRAHFSRSHKPYRRPTAFKVEPLEARLLLSADPLGALATDAAIEPQIEAPIIEPQTFAVNENSDIGTPVGTVVANDPDGAGGLTYAETGGGTGASAFAVAPDGAITVEDSSLLDFETTASFTLDVQVTDIELLSATATMTIDLNDVNEAPTVDPQTFAVDENSPNGTTVGTVVANDPDAGQLWW